jgi:5'-3' exonuclease, N-terminal resolvase-like domain
MIRNHCSIVCAQTVTESITRYSHRPRISTVECMRLQIVLVVVMFSSISATFRSTTLRLSQHAAFLSINPMLIPNRIPLHNYAQNDSPRKRSDGYSLDDLKDNKRPFPPMLDSQYEEEGFGAHTYFDIEEELTNVQQQPMRVSIDVINRNVEKAPKEPLRQFDSDRLEEIVSSSSDSLSKYEVEKSVYSSSTELPTSNSDTNASTYVPETLESLQAQIDKVQTDIYMVNNATEFNINSSRQVSQALFDGAIQSTNKDALEVQSAAGNAMAGLILEYRSLKNRINSLTRKQGSVLKGTDVKDVLAVGRPTPGDVSIGVEKSMSDERNLLENEHVLPLLTLQEQHCDPIILVDASSYIFRAYYTMPPIHRGDGMPTGAVMGFCKMMNSMFLTRMLSEEEPPRVVMCFDAKGKTFRHEMYPLYKANRPPAPMDLIPQFDLVRQAAQAYGICQIEAPSYEADDVIATIASMAKAEGVDTNILSGKLTWIP